MALGKKTGGRTKGTANKRTSALSKAMDMLMIQNGLTPLEFLLTVMRDRKHDFQLRIDAGKAAAPYIHPKLSNIELTGADKGPLGVTIVRYSDPAQSMGAKAVPNEGVASPGTGMPPRRTPLAPAQR